MGVQRNRFTNWVKSLSNKEKILIGIVVTLTVIAILYQFEWSGFGIDENKSDTTKALINPRTGEILLNPKTGKIITFTETTTKHESAKTLWDWLGLAGTIAIPFALFYFERSEQRRSEKRSQELEVQNKREKELAEENARGEKELAEENARREKELADNNLREQALEAYIDRISELLIDKNLKVLISKNDVKKNEVEKLVIEAALDIARARTLSILRRLDHDGERKASVVLFLSDAELISHLDLKSADLKGVYLESTNLDGAKLKEANLEGVYLCYASLKNANLFYANLISADLLFVDLRSADLTGAKLNGTNLEYANLEGANLKNATLDNANLENTKLSSAENLTPDQVKKAKNWEKARYDKVFRAKLGLPPNEL